MDSTNTLPQLETGQAQNIVTANMLFAAASPSMAYGRNGDTSAGLVFGYFGTRYGGTAVANGTNTNGASTTTYMVAHLTTGAVSFSTATTNWDNSGTYGRCYKIVTGGSSVTSYEDHRFGPGGIHSGQGTSRLDGLDDTDLVGSPSPSNGQVLTYNATAGKWYAGTAAAGGVSSVNGESGAVSLQLGDLTDVDTLGSPSPTNGQLLAWNSALGKWQPTTRASLTQTDEFISGYIGTVADKTYKIVVKAAHGGTITETTTISESGTVTATFKINTTALGGTANSVSSSEQSQAQASANVFAAGDDLQITTSSNSACLGMSFTIKYTRTLA